LSNQPPADPDQPWKKPEEAHGQPSPDSPTSPLPVSGNPWSSPSGDALAPEPYKPPATAEPPEPYHPPTGVESPGTDQPPAGVETPGYQPPQPPAAPTFKPGHASLPRPPAPQPLPPTSIFPQQPRSASGGQGGYPPQPDPNQPYPPPAYAPESSPGPQQPYSAPPAYSPESAQPPHPGYPAQQGYAGQHGYAVQHGGYGPPPGSGQPPPGFGQPPPGYGQPPPGYGQPPPKRSNVPIVAVILAVALLLCGGVATAGVLAFNRAKDRAEEALKPITDPAFPTEIPQVPGLPTDVPDFPTDIPNFPDPDATAKEITVVYEVTGDGPASIIYTEKLGESPKRLDNVDLPWQVETTMTGATLVSVTAIRSGTDTGAISCRATVDGEEVAQRTREGTFATASCIKMVF